MAKKLTNITIKPAKNYVPQLDRLKKMAGKRQYMGERKKTSLEFPMDLFIEFHAKATKNKTSMTALFTEFMEEYINK